MSLTIPDAIAKDLKADLLSHLPSGLSLDADRVRSKNEGEELPSPRVVILCGEPRPVRGMNGTARVPVSVEWITSQDSVTEGEHNADAARLDGWWQALKASKRRAVISENIYLHDLIHSQPMKSLRPDDREQVTTIRGDLVVTLMNLT